SHQPDHQGRLGTPEVGRALVIRDEPIAISRHLERVVREARLVPWIQRQSPEMIEEREPAKTPEREPLQSAVRCPHVSLDWHALGDCVSISRMGVPALLRASESVREIAYKTLTTNELASGRPTGRGR